MAEPSTTPPSPHIAQQTWGEIQISGDLGPFKDAKLYPGGGREWDWNETGTEHYPGIQPADIEELLEHGAEHIILSQGVYERLGVHMETCGRLEHASIPFEVLQTEEAVARYNELQEQGVAVGGLFHSTC